MFLQRRSVRPVAIGALWLAAQLFMAPAVALGAERVELTLAQAVEAVLRGNPDLMVSRFDPQAADAAVTSARGTLDTELYVSAVDGLSGSHSTATSALEGVDAVDQTGQSATAGVAKRFGTGTQVDASLRVARTATNVDYANFNPQTTSSLSLQLTQPLLRDRGSVNRQAIVVASVNADLSRAQLKASLQRTVFDACQAYWELTFRGADLEVKAQALSLAQEQLARNQEQVRLGSLAPVEMIQAEQAVASAEFQRVQAEIELANAQDALRALMGLGAPGMQWDTELVPIDAPEPAQGAIDIDGAVAVALAEEPTVAQARLAADARSVELSGAGNQRLPQLDLIGGFGISGIGGVPTDDNARPVYRFAEPIGPADVAEQMFTGDNYQWSVGLLFRMPLHNYAARGNFEQASVGDAQAKAQLRAAEQAAAVGVRRAARQLMGQAKAVEAAQKARTLSERQLEAEERKFAMGTATNFQVLQFQRELAQARTQELRALVDLEIARAALNQAQGVLLEAVGVMSTGAP